MTPLHEGTVLVFLTAWCWYCCWGEVSKVEMDESGIREVRIRHHKNKDHNRTSHRHPRNRTTNEFIKTEDTGYVVVTHPPAEDSIHATTGSALQNFTQIYSVNESYGTTYPWWVVQSSLIFTLFCYFGLKCDATFAFVFVFFYTVVDAFRNRSTKLL